MRNRNIVGALIVAVFLLTMLNPIKKIAETRIGSDLSLISLSSGWMPYILISFVVIFIGIVVYGLYENMKYN